MVGILKIIKINTVIQEDVILQKKKDREYIPEKYPHYNSSNYRGEYSFARWTRRTGEEHEIS